jgi:hypothetical protein
MDLAVRIMRGGGILAAIFVFGALPPNNAARGQPAASAPPPQFEPASAAAPLLDPDLFKFPHSSSNYDSSKFKLDKYQKESPGVTLPNRIDLGASTLRLDTDRSAVNNGPRVGIEAVDPAQLNPGIPTRKDSPLTPNYFGLTFTAPTH